MGNKKPANYGSHHSRRGGTHNHKAHYSNNSRTQGGFAASTSTGTAVSGSSSKMYGTSTSAKETCFEKQLFDFIIVVDFECTCERDRRTYPNEIIEFPAILIDVRAGGKILKQHSFRSYAKPWRNPELTAFCTELTGITQQHVEKAPDLQHVVKNFEAWYRRTIPAGAKVMMATDGPWDFKNFVFEGAVKRDHVAFPTLFYEYLDIRTTFSNFFNKGRPAKLERMMSRLGLRFEGRPHCGFDDAVNIARLAVAMMKHGCLFQFVIALPLDEDEYHYQMDVTPLYRKAGGGSGLVDRMHVEERAKACFGEAYYSYGGSTFAAAGGGANGNNNGDDDSDNGDTDGGAVSAEVLGLRAAAAVLADGGSLDAAEEALRHHIRQSVAALEAVSDDSVDEESSSSSGDDNDDDNEDCSEDAEKQEGASPTSPQSEQTNGDEQADDADEKSTPATKAEEQEDAKEAKKDDAAKNAERLRRRDARANRRRTYNRTIADIYDRCADHVERLRADPQAFLASVQQQQKEEEERKAALLVKRQSATTNSRIAFSPHHGAAANGAGGRNVYAVGSGGASTFTKTRRSLVRFLRRRPQLAWFLMGVMVPLVFLFLRSFFF